MRGTRVGYCDSLLSLVAESRPFPVFVSGQEGREKEQKFPFPSSVFSPRVKCVVARRRIRQAFSPKYVKKSMQKLSSSLSCSQDVKLSFVEFLSHRQSVDLQDGESAKRGRKEKTFSFWEVSGGALVGQLSFFFLKALPACLSLISHLSSRKEGGGGGG